MIVPKNITFILLLLLLPAFLFAGGRMRRQQKEYKEFYENGTVKKITQVKTAQTVGFELDNNYKKTNIWSVEFFENGRTKSSFHKITKIGSAGKNCYEIKSVTKTYYPNGKLKQKEIAKCDKGKTTIRYYDEKGKLTFTKIIYDLI